MRKIIVISMITLDGVMQGMGNPDEDTSGGFKYGGWSEPYGDQVAGKDLQELMQPTDYLLGRKTFEILATYWSQNETQWPGINNGTKYVFSKNMKKADWKNTVFVESVEDIQKLKQSEGPDLQVWGSSKLIQLLLAHDLVDELRLQIHPLILGSGKKLFDEGEIATAFTLTNSLTTPSGVIIAHYERAGEVKTGTIEA
jgi:dihydrofolate reductase